jgi:lysophospholipase L1-like esterase
VRPLALLIAVLAALSLLTPPASASPTTIITVGTSIEAGVGVNPGESWPSRLDARTDATVTDLSLGGGAYTAPNSVGDTIRKHVEQAIEQHPDVIILGGPVNDLVRLSDVTPLREAVFDAANAVQAAGIRVVVVGIFPFSDGGAFAAGWWPTLEQRRTTYNQWASYMYGNAYVDLTWCLHETTSYRADARWFRDGLHPTRVGDAVIAECFPLERLG